MMEIDESHKKCIEILLNGNLTIDEETGVLSFDLREEDKAVFIEFAVNVILRNALNSLEETLENK